MSKLAEKMARANYEQYWQGSSAKSWNKLPTDNRRLFINAQRAALAVVLEEMREPSEGMADAGLDIDAHFWRGTVTEMWRAMLAQFEKENTGG